LDLWSSIGLSVAILGGISVVFGLLLWFANNKLKVPVDEKFDAVRACLAGANCGVCGFSGCDAYAKALVDGAAPPDACPMCKGAMRTELADVLGIELPDPNPMTAHVACRGDNYNARHRFTYQGLKDCGSAAMVSQGHKACRFGCMGLGSCAAACPFGALTMSPEGLPKVDRSLCVACKRCEAACPKGLISMVPANEPVRIACHASVRGADVRENCTVGCLGCGLCVKACRYSAIELKDFLPTIDYSKCRHCGVCAAKCPAGTIEVLLDARHKAQVDAGACSGCGVCANICPAKAIYGHENQLHHIFRDLCVGCGMCKEACPSSAITLTEEGGKKRA